MKHIAYLALGTNLGDRIANLRAAQIALEPEVHVLRCSPIYETPPWGFTDQPSFLNQALEVETGLSPSDLLKTLKRLEEKLGRQPNFRNGPRLIDIDILFYDSLVLSQSGLDIPHPRIEDRAFVLVPLADLAPDQRHPVNGRTVREMLDQVDREGISLFSPDGCRQPKNLMVLKPNRGCCG